MIAKRLKRRQDYVSYIETGQKRVEVVELMEWAEAIGFDARDAMLGKLYDDRGNRMSPSFSTKKGIRYRFYISSALLRGRKAAAGSVARVAAGEIEAAVLAALKPHQQASDACDVIYLLERVVVARSRLLITMASGGLPRQAIVVPWTVQQKDARPTIEGNGSPNDTRNESLIQSVIRAHAWMHLLKDGNYSSIEELADANNIHPKVIRQNLRLASLAPEVTCAILDGSQPEGLSLARIPKVLSLKWTDHRSPGLIFRY